MDVDLQQQWDAVKAAPVLYLGAILVVTGIIWVIVNYVKRHEISALEARLRLRDDELEDRKRKLAARGSNESQAAAAPRHPDGIYQYGQRVGKVGGAQERISQGEIAFPWVQANDEFNPDTEIDYRDFVLKLKGYDTLGTVMMPGHIASQYGNAVFTILNRS